MAPWYARWPLGEHIGGAGITYSCKTSPFGKAIGGAGIAGWSAVGITGAAVAGGSNFVAHARSCELPLLSGTCGFDEAKFAKSSGFTMPPFLEGSNPSFLGLRIFGEVRGGGGAPTHGIDARSLGDSVGGAGIATAKRGDVVGGGGGPSTVSAHNGRLGTATGRCSNVCGSLGESFGGGAGPGAGQVKSATDGVIGVLGHKAAKT